MEILEKLALTAVAISFTLGIIAVIAIHVEKLENLAVILFYVAVLCFLSLPILALVAIWTT